MRTCNSLTVTETKDGLSRQVWPSLSPQLYSFEVSHLRFPQVHHTTESSICCPDTPKPWAAPARTSDQFFTRRTERSTKRPEVIKSLSCAHKLALSAQNLPIYEAVREIQLPPLTLGINFSSCSVCSQLFTIQKTGVWAWEVHKLGPPSPHHALHMKKNISPYS